MKNLIQLLSAVMFTAILISSCAKENESDADYYAFSEDSKISFECDFSALRPVYNRYSSVRLYCKDTSEEDARALWVQAEADFKSVEPKLIAAEGKYIEVKLQKYHPTDRIYNPVQTIGSWRFPASE